MDDFPTSSQGQGEARAVYDVYRAHNAGLRIHTDTNIQDVLHEQYPTYDLRSTTCDLIKYAEASHASATLLLDKAPALRSLAFEPAARKTASDLVAGNLKEVVNFGRYQYGWRDKVFEVYVVDGQNNLLGQCDRRCYILIPPTQQHEHDQAGVEAIEALVLEASLWLEQGHDEVWVYDQGRWSKDKELWRMVQRSNWDDIILDGNIKQAIMSDVIGFFDSEDLYAELGTPWKRGLIFHGSPGNGKTTTAKALMKSLGERAQPVPTLIVKTLAQRSFGPQMSIRQIFTKARQTTPCVLLFEDVDSLVTDQVRSYFFNEVDGLEDNEGILMIASTNNLEKLDIGLSKRPSRFDRKYQFINPGKDQRLRYCEYWMRKLSSKPATAMPPHATKELARITQGFSFAYLKEVYIAALLALTQHNDPDKHVAETENATQMEDLGKFGNLLQQQIMTLKADMAEEGKSTWS